MSEFAPGIEDPTKFPELPVIKKPFATDYVIQIHKAHKAGEHRDLRINIPGIGAYSWAGREIPKPGNHSYVKEQPIHSSDYCNFQGTLGEGYGKGTVHIHDRDRIEILNSRPGHISFAIYKPSGIQEFTLHELGDKVWKLYNRTLTREKLTLPSEKPKYKEKEPHEILNTDGKYVMQEKIDGASNLVYFGQKGDPIRLFSHRIPKKGETGLIQHEHKIPKLMEARVDKDTQNTILRAETYAIDPNTSKATHPALIGGMLNTSVWKSREKQKELGHLTNAIYDVIKYKGKDVEHLPYKDKLEILKEIVNKYPDQFHLPQMAFDEKSKQQLFHNIRSGKYAHNEGVVLHNLYESEKPIKGKFTKEFDVYIKEIFPAEGKYKERAAGGFTFSHTPDGPVVGRIGTGFSDSLRKDMHNYPEKYKGLIAVVSGNELYRSGAIKQPAFKNFHLDKNDKERLENIIHK